MDVVRQSLALLLPKYFKFLHLDTIWLLVNGDARKAAQELVNDIHVPVPCTVVKLMGTTGLHKYMQVQCMDPSLNIGHRTITKEHTPSKERPSTQKVINVVVN